MLFSLFVVRAVLFCSFIYSFLFRSKCEVGAFGLIMVVSIRVRESFDVSCRFFCFFSPRLFDMMRRGGVALFGGLRLC